MLNDRVIRLIREAYPSETGEVLGAPPWVESERYDIEGKIEGVAEVLGRERLRPLLRSLLADRFKLALHHEKRKRRIQELVRRDPGAPLRSSLRRIDVNCDDMNAQTIRSIHGGTIPTIELASNGAPRCNVMNTGGIIRSGGVAMEQVAAILWAITGTPVRDRTNLTGFYEFTLHYNNAPISTNARPNDASRGGSIVSALQEQLGLKLQATDADVDVLVVDRIEHPTDN